MKNKDKQRYTRYTSKHLKHRNLRFWICWLILAALIVYGLAVTHGYFDRVLTSYEEAQYYHVADAMARPFVEGDFDAIMQLPSVQDGIKSDCFETRSLYRAHLEDLTGDALIEYSRIGSADPDEIRYQITADGKKYAEFTLKKTGETRSFELIPVLGYKVGVDLYEPGEITVNIHSEVVYDYTIPSYANITVNGVLLSNSYVVNEGTDIIRSKDCPEGFTLRSYRFSYHLGMPEVHVKDGNGNEIPMYDQGQDIYTCGEPETYTYVVPTTAVLTVDGQPVGEDCVTGEDQKMFFDGHLYGKNEAYKLRTYSLLYLGEAPEAEAVREDGTAVELKQDEENPGRFAFEFEYDETLRETYRATAEEFVKKWCLFSTHNVKIATVRNLTVRDSKAWNFIGNYEATWITSADSYEFMDLSSEKYALVGKNMVTCEAYVTYHTRSKGKDNDYPTKLRLYMTLSDNTWRIYDFEILPAELPGT